MIIAEKYGRNTNSQHATEYSTRRAVSAPMAKPIIKYNASHTHIRYMSYVPHTVCIHVHIRLSRKIPIYFPNT